MGKSLQDAGVKDAAADNAEKKEVDGKDTKCRPPTGTGGFIRWSPRLLLIFGGMLAIVLFFGGKTMLAYTDRPEYCLNCHVMEQQYESWFHSAHRSGATCGDCHVPHQNLAAKLVGKGTDGLRDVFYFYTNQVPDPIRLSDRGGKIVRENCLRCHGNLMEKVHEDRNCWECHRSVPHGQ